MILPWQKKTLTTPVVDLHSHLIPGIDDGSSSLESSVEMISQLKQLGYQKAITTPHIHPYYPNNSETISNGLESVQNELGRLEIDFELEAAAEYFVDETFQELVDANNILSFGDQFVLVESSFLNKPLLFENCLFELMAKGYKPILAHPERYKFLDDDIEWLLELKEMGILFQVTISSFAGFYGPRPKQIARQLHKKNMIDFLGSDLHSTEHIHFLEKGLKEKEVRKLCSHSELMNKQLR